jgi:predicted permease
MTWWSRLLQRHKRDQELERELEFHVAASIADHRRSGLSEIEARRRVYREFGGVEQLKEECRDARGTRWFEDLLQDIRLAVRALRKTPVWTAVVCLTLAFGIGLSTAIFSVVYSVLLQPLPYPQAKRLVAVWLSAPKAGYSRFYVNAAHWVDWRTHATLLEDIALVRPVANFNLTGSGTPERLQGARTSFNLPRVLGVTPLLGRTFSEEEQRTDARVALLSYTFWRQRFGGDASILSRKISLNGEPFQVIGVMPPYYQYPAADFQLWTPLYIAPDEIVHGMNNQYLCVARLKRGVSLKQVQAEFSRMMLRFSEEHRSGYRSPKDAETALVEPLSQSDAFQIRSTLYALLGAVGCLLLIGCMNVAVLLIARANARTQETAVRIALGATQTRIQRQLFTELIPLSGIGIASGLLLAWCMLQALLSYLPPNTPRAGSIGLSAPVVLFAVGISLIVVFLAGLLPARMAARNSPGGDLQQSSRSVTGSAQARDGLVIAQIALTIILLIGALLFVRSFTALIRVNPGFSSQGVLTMQLAVTRAKYPQDERVAEYYRQIVDGVESIHGVLAAGIVNRLPFSGVAQTGGIEFEDRTGHYDSDWRSATPGYFEAIGIPLRRGRLLQYSDRPKTTPVGLIDERLARRVFGAENPIGKRFRRYLPDLSPKNQDPWTVVVGVVGHILNDNLEQDIRPQVYWPETQRTQDRGAVVVRTAGDPEGYIHAVETEIQRQDRDQPVYDVRTMRQWVDRTLQRRTLLTGLIAFFGGASLLLACVGLYGVVSYTANLRQREFGVRMALGADRQQVCALVLRHAGSLAILGSSIGLVIAWPVSRAIQSLLFSISSSDFVAWFVAPVLLIAVALVSSLSPAWKAAKTDPALTLRAD